MDYLLANTFIPNWGVYTMAIIGFILIVSLFILSKRVGALEDTAEELEEKNSKSRFNSPGFKAFD